jgi:uncharacterized membrane protein YbjE (DUF340 family)
MISLLVIVIGVGAGVWLRGYLGPIEGILVRSQDFLLQGLLFATSATFGANAEVRGSLGTLGAASLVTAIAAVSASALAGHLWGRRFDRPEPGEAGGDGEPGEGHSHPTAALLSAVTAASVVSGYITGFALTGSPFAARLSAVSMACLYALLLVIGYDLGRQRIWRRIAEHGAWCFTLPVAVGAATLAGAAIAGAAMGLPVGRALSAGAGFGWYSLAGAAALEAAGAEVGAYVFLSNLFRELITLLVSPLLAGRVSPAAGAALGGATSMDSTLPSITRSFGPMGTVWGLVTGTALSLATPFLLNLFLRLPL